MTELDEPFRIEIDEDVAAAYPETRIAVVTATGLRNAEPWAAVDRAVEALVSAFGAAAWSPLSEVDAGIACWHDAFRSFGVNPRRMRPSVDALGRRFAKVGDLPRIGPAVDAYNFVSLRHGIPVGAFDLDAVPRTPVELRPARGGDRFVPIGADADAAEEPRPGEVVYAAGADVLTRAWNYRDCDRTKVTASSRSVAFVLERVDATAVPDAALAQAVDDLVSLVGEHADDVAVSLTTSADGGR